MNQTFFARISSGSLTTPESDLTLIKTNWFHLEGRESPTLKVLTIGNITVVLAGVIYGPYPSETSQRQETLIFDLYSRSGIEGLNGLKGQFACFIIDWQQESIFVMGDVTGGRKVFYTYEKEGYVVSTKLFPIAEALAEFPNPDLEVRDFILIYGFAPLSRTVYSDIRRTLAGEYLQLKDAKIKSSNFHKNDIGSSRFQDSVDEIQELEVQKELERRLRKVTNEITSGHDKIAVFLGGFDSALVAALAKQTNKEVVALTFKYENSTFNQKNISEVVDALGIEHHWVPISAEMIGKGLETFPHLFDRPTNWPNYLIQTTELANFAKALGCTVILTGDGCDEVFLGYPGIYRGSKFFDGDVQWGSLPTKILTSSLLSSFGERYFGHVYRLLLRVSRNKSLPKKTRLYLMYRILDENTLHYFFNEPLKSIEARVESTRSMVMKSIRNSFDTTQLAYEGRDNIVPNRLKLVGLMDSTGIPTYSPYLDPSIREYVSTLPEKLLRPNSKAKKTSLGKDILLRMANRAGLLPEKVIYQPKHAAVDGPLDFWYSNELSKQVEISLRGLNENISHKVLKSFTRKLFIETVYAKFFSVDSITSHATSMLVTYSSFFVKK